MFTKDPVTLVMAAIILAAFAAPFLLHLLKRNQKKAQLSQEFKRLSEPFIGPVDIQDSWRNQYMIGLITASKTFLYLKDGADPVFHAISMDQVEDIQVKSKTREIKAPKERKVIIDEIGLQISLKGQKPLYLEFFNQDNFTDLLGESVLAEKWATLLKNQRC